MPLSPDSLSEFLRTKLGIDTSAVDEQTPLFSTGLLDSFSMLDLILFVETESGSRMSPLDVNLDNLDSIDRIMRFASRARS